MNAETIIILVVLMIVVGIDWWVNIVNGGKHND